MRSRLIESSIICLVLLIAAVSACAEDRQISIVLDSIPINDVIQVPPGDAIIRGQGSDIIASVTGSATENAGIWTYTYVVRNAADSPRTIWSFTLVPVHTPLSMIGPEGWRPDSAFQQYGEVNWFCVDTGPSPPNNQGRLSPSPYDIWPGDSATFGFTSQLSPVPGHATFYVQGFMEIPIVGEEDNIDSVLSSRPLFLEDSYSGTIVGPGAAPAGIEDGEPRPEARLRLSPGRPNPMTTSATLGFSLEQRGQVSLAIYDAAGRRVRMLVDKELGLGIHYISWDGRDDRGVPVSAGVYFYQLKINGGLVGTQKSIVVR